jgi:Sep-tRNA:Cys-tRNA synthetase
MNLRTLQEDYIDLNPLQAGGRTVAETRLVVNSYADGYAGYDQYSGPFFQIPRKETALLHKQLNEFLGTDEIFFTHGVREAKVLLFQSILKDGDLIVIDGNAHFSTIAAASKLGLEIFSIKNSGSPDYKIDPRDYEAAILQLKKEHKKPKLLVLTQVDGNYGNLVDARKVTLIAKKYNIPLLLNSAYLAGRTRVNLAEIGADFIVISGHKSFGVPGHIGGLGVTQKWVDKIQDPSKEDKPWDLPARYLAIVGLYASLETTDKRVARWDDEVKKANWFVEKMESIGGIRLVGERPKQHDLILFDTPVLEKIALTKRKKGYFLADELKKVGIVGLRPGQTQQIRISTYGLTREQLDYVYKTFVGLVKEEKYGI